MFYGIMSDIHTRIAVCCCRGKVGTDLSVFWVAYDLFLFSCRADVR